MGTRICLVIGLLFRICVDLSVSAAVRLAYASVAKISSDVICIYEKIAGQ